MARSAPDFRVLDPLPLRTAMTTAFGGLALESGALLAAKHWVIGSLLMLSGGAVLGWYLGRMIHDLLRWTVRFLNFRIRVVPSILMIIAAIIGLPPVLHRWSGTGDGHGRNGVTKNRVEEQPDVALGDEDKAGAGNRSATKDEEPGVILMPETKPHPMLVPPMPALGQGAWRLTHTKPLSIPFYGVYHFFRRRDVRLPKNSNTRQGTPSVVRFRSTDGSPIVMEAHQNLGTFIDVSCCAAVQIGFTNADSYRSTVFIEVILRDTLHRQALSLGALPVSSGVAWAPGHDTGSVSDTLRFGMKISSGLRRFDEFTVRFHLASVRAERSAKMAIDNFVLIPRGL